MSFTKKSMEVNLLCKLWHIKVRLINLWRILYILLQFAVIFSTESDKNFHFLIKYSPISFSFGIQKAVLMKKKNSKKQSVSDFFFPVFYYFSLNSH